MRMLVVDDEAEIADMLAEYFTLEGFEVTCANSGSEALVAAPRGFDIILLDVNMPGMDGFEVCRRIREHLSCPIIFLTARIEDVDQLDGFAAGADDYVLKSFSLPLLSKRTGQVFDRDAIYERVWGWDGTGDASLVREHIRRIRKKFQLAGVAADPIETVWGVGYKWVAR